MTGEMQLHKELVREWVKEPAFARQVVGATGIDQVANEARALVDEIGGFDDGVDPATPAGVTVTAFMRALAVAWVKAPPGDRVESTVIRLTPPTGTPKLYTFRHADGAAWIDQIDTAVSPQAYTVEVKHVDRYERSSPWYVAGSATPSGSTVDYIVADNISAGNLKAAVSILSGAYIATLGARMDIEGFKMEQLADALSAPSVSRGSKLTPNVAEPFTALSFYSLPNIGRGMLARSDGNGSNLKGEVRIEATHAGNPSFRTARVQLFGGPGAISPDTYVRIAPHLILDGPADLNGVITQVGTGFNVGAGGRVNAMGLDVNGTINQLGTQFAVGSGGAVAAAAFNSTAGITFRNGSALRQQDSLGANILFQVSGAGGLTAVTGTFTNALVMPAATVGTPELINQAVTGAKILDLTIGANKIADNQILSRHHAAGAVDNAALGTSAVTAIKIHPSLENPADNIYGLRTIGGLLGGTSVAAAAADHSHASGETSSFEVLPVAERRRSLAQRLTIRRKLRDFKPIEGEGVSAEDYNNLLGYVQLLASQIQTLSHLLQDAPDRDAFEREDMFRRGEITDENIFFEYRHGHKQHTGRHIALLPHKWTMNAHPDLAA